MEGAALDVDQALAAVSFEPYLVYRKGDLTRGRKPQVREKAGFWLYASTASANDLPLQCEEAEKFLQKHFDEILSIQGVDDAELDFAYDCRLGTGEGGKEIMLQCDYLPASLIKICGELSIGIALTLFPPCDEDSETESGEISIE